MPKQRDSRDGDDNDRHIGDEQDTEQDSGDGQPSGDGRGIGETRQFAPPEFEHAHDPDEVTVQLDVAGARLEDWLVQQAKGPRGAQGVQEPSDGPVFVDETGRRSRRYRRIGMAVGLACAVYAVVIIVTLLSGNSSAPWLPVPGKEDDKPASRVDSPTLPPASADPSAPANPSAGPNPSADPGTTSAPGVDPLPSTSVSPTESDEPTEPEPSDPATEPEPTVDPPTGPDPTNDPTDEPTTPTQDPDPDPTPTDDPTVDPPPDGSDSVAGGQPAGDTASVEPIGVIDVIEQPPAPSSPEIIL
ncbi:hypothetical protein GCM10023080_072460 [Streptomyces pseudoechinosporeus]